MASKINFQEGTIEFSSKINYSAEGTMFSFFNIKDNQDEISLELKNKTDFIFTHIYNNQTNRLVFDFTDYFDKKNTIAVTWNLKGSNKSLALYMSGVLKKTETIK